MVKLPSGALARKARLRFGRPRRNGAGKHRQSLARPRSRCRIRATGGVSGAGCGHHWPTMTAGHGCEKPSYTDQYGPDCPMISIFFQNIQFSVMNIVSL